MQHRSAEYREVTLDLHLVEYSATILMITTYILEVLTAQYTCKHSSHWIMIDRTDYNNNITNYRVLQLLMMIE